MVSLKAENYHQYKGLTSFLPAPRSLFAWSIMHMFLFASVLGSATDKMLKKILLDFYIYICAIS